jgi:non-specific serine/threonine protein kinase
VPLTPLIGRTEELELVRAALEQGARLVTLTGPGGAGKTRLAIELVHDGGPRFDGVVWVSLAHVREEQALISTLAQSLGCGLADDLRMVRDAIARLGPRSLLLVLDNLEQLPEAGATVGALLASCPTLTVLATSRGRLRVTGERAIPLGPLQLPEMHATIAQADLAESMAVRLFVERARAVRPGFVLDAATASIVADICRMVDSLPLAIELAAARLAHLEPETLAAMLQDRLRVLIGGNLDLPPRQRQIRDTIAWSYDLLSAEEQGLFRRLAVFRGGFSLIAAAAIAGPTQGDTPGQIETTDLLGRLVEISLVQFQPAEQPAREARYTLLETVRAFALGRAEAEEDMLALRERHARWYLTFAQQHAFSYASPAYTRDLARMGAEGANISDAMQWFAASNNGDCLLLMCSELVQTWHARGYSRAEIDLMERALAEASQAPTRVRSRAMIGLAYLIHRQPDAGDRATELAKAGLEIDRGSVDGARMLEDLVINAVVASYRGDLDSAEAFLNEALGVIASMPDEGLANRYAADVEHMLGGYARRRGDHSLAQEHQVRAVTLGREAGDRWIELDAVLALGRLAWEHHDPDAAIDWYRQGFDATWPTGHPIVDAHAVAGIASAAVLLHRLEQAAKLLGAATATLRRGGIIAQLPLDADPIALAEAAVRQTVSPSDWLAWSAKGARWSIAETRQACEEILALESPARGKPTVTLTRREADILPLLALGLTHRAIGERLYIGERTVDSHVARLFAKLDVHSRSAALTLAKELDLLQS